MENDFNTRLLRHPVFWYVKEEGAAQSSVTNGEEATEPTLVRSGKWKIPSSKDYLDLFKGLMDCENMKVGTYQPLDMHFCENGVSKSPSFFSTKPHLNTVIIKPVLIQELLFMFPPPRFSADLGWDASRDILTYSAIFLFILHASNMSSAIVESNYVCVFTGKRLKEDSCACIFNQFNQKKSLQVQNQAFLALTILKSSMKSWRNRE